MFISSTKWFIPRTFSHAVSIHFHMMIVIINYLSVDLIIILFSNEVVSILRWTTISFRHKTNSVSLTRIFANLWIRPCVSVQRSMENESTRCGKTARGGSLFCRFLTCHRKVLPFSQMLSTCSFTLRSSALSRFFGSEKRSICRHWSLATFPYVDLALHSHPSFFLSFLRFRLDRVVPTSTKSFKMLLRWVQRSFLFY